MPENKTAPRRNLKSLREAGSTNAPGQALFKSTSPAMSLRSAAHQPVYDIHMDLVDRRIGWLLLQKRLHPERAHVKAMPGDPEADLWRDL